MMKSQSIFLFNKYYQLVGLIFINTFFINSFLLSQSPNKISGIVYDESGEPLIGVNVVVKGTTNGTITDLNGKFTILTDLQPSTLAFSYLGYGTKEMMAKFGDYLTINLSEDAKILEDIVVVGYGTQRKKDLTGSIAIVNTENMQKMQSPGIGQALQGMVSGLRVTTSGQPGAGADIQIRGISSFSSANPLFVIDGMILDGSTRQFNMNDVESIQVLKDAAASALYGARGANGVIVITTKKGKDGPMKIDVLANFGVDQIANRIKMMNSIEFLRLSRMAYENANLPWIGEPEQNQVLISTDWQDQFFKLGRTQNYNVAASGGNANGNYLLSFNYFGQEGTTIGTSYDRITLRTNTEARKGILTIGENLSIGNSNTNPMAGSPFIELMKMPPVIPVYNQDGTYGFGTASFPTYGENPIAMQNNNQTTQISYRIVGNAFVQIEPLKNLKLKSNMGIEYFNWFDKELTLYKQSRYLTTSVYQNQLLERKGNYLTWIWENTLTYEKKIKKHAFDALLGYSAQETTNQNHTAAVYDVTDGFWVLSSGVREPDVQGTNSESAMTSILGRINYNYDDKYLLQANIRRDGSSRFGRNYRYGNFPSASLGWRISKENFFKQATSVIDDLKIRISYGVLGDQQTIGNYDYATYIITGEGAILGNDQKYYDGAIQKGHANSDLRWEKNSNLNAGFDFSMINQHLHGSIEYYHSKAEDLLLTLPISWTTGTDIKPWTNYGAVKNEGIEITLGWRETKRPFKWNITTNVSINHNEVLRLGDLYREEGLSGINRSEVGRSIGDFYVVRMDGIFQNWDEIYAHTTTLENGTVKLIQPNAKPGDIRYKDLNQDGSINKDDREYVGSPLPKFEYGLNFNAEYKGMDVNIFLYGVSGNLIFNNVKFWLERMDGVSNYPAGLKPWTEENPSTTTPRAVIGTTDNAIQYSDRWIEKGDYLRIKNFQLGYTLPKSLMNTTGFLNNFRIYIGAQNLFTLTKYSGYDPEISGGSVFAKGNDAGHYPPVRTFTCGLQLSF